MSDMHLFGCDATDRNSENAFQAAWVKIPFDFGVERSPKHPLDDLGAKTAPRRWPATHLGHMLFPHENQHVILDLPLNVQASAVRRERTIF